MIASCFKNANNGVTARWRNFFYFKEKYLLSRQYEKVLTGKLHIKNTMCK